MRFSSFFKKTFWYWMLAVLILIRFLGDAKKLGFWQALQPWHFLFGVMATAFFLSILSYIIELDGLQYRIFFKKDVLISGSIAVMLIIPGLVYWTGKYWIAFAGFTFVFYLILFGYGFVINLFKRNK